MSQAEIAHIRELLSRAPDDDILGRMSLESRITELKLKESAPVKKLPRPLVTRREKIAAVRADIAYVEDLLSRLPEDDILGRYSFEGHLDSLRDELEKRTLALEYEEKI